MTRSFVLHFLADVVEVLQDTRIVWQGNLVISSSTNLNRVHSLITLKDGRLQGARTDGNMLDNSTSWSVAFS